MIEALRRIIAENNQARRSHSSRLARLTDVLHSGDPDEFHRTATGILDESIEALRGPAGEDSSVLGPDGETEPLGGSARDEANEVGGRGSPQESGS